VISNRDPHLDLDSYENMTSVAGNAGIPASGNPPNGSDPKKLFGPERLNPAPSSSGTNSSAKSSKADGKIKRFLNRFKSKAEPNPESNAYRRRTSSVGTDEEVTGKKKTLMGRYPGIECEPKSAPNL
jgi:hypothetical protein